MCQVSNAYDNFNEEVGKIFNSCVTDIQNKLNCVYNAAKIIWEAKKVDVRSDKITGAFFNDSASKLW